MNKTTRDRLTEINKLIVAKHGPQANPLPELLVDAMRQNGFNQATITQNLDKAIKLFHEQAPKDRATLKHDLQVKLDQMRRQHEQEAASLHEQLNKIMEQEKAEEAERKRQLGLKMLQNIDIFLGLRTGHDLSSCNDKNTAIGGCHRCALLNLKKESWRDEWPWDEIDIEITVLVKD